MLKFKNQFIIIKCVLYISIFIDIFLQYNNHHLMMILLFNFAIILIINDYLRNIKLNSPTKYSYISLFFSICAATMLQFIVVGESTNLYQYFLIFDFFKFEKNILKLFISMHFLLYLLHFFTINLNIQSSNINISLFLTFSLILLFYFSIVGMLYSKKMLEIEKEEVKQLNKKLRLANIKLQEYTLKVEEVAISRERTRVAQELHDSLGHSLMALVMNLEFAKKICTNKPLKVEEVLIQSEKIAKSSINDLRKAVTLLNSEHDIIDLNTAIERLIINFYLVGNLKITYIKDKTINDLSAIIKTSIYRVIQESITNSLKHGNATEINIKITIATENVQVIITDNGIGCNNIIKSHGLNGIEKRINSVGGSTYYFSHNDLGFGIKLFIPI